MGWEGGERDGEAGWWVGGGLGGASCRKILLPAQWVGREEGCLEGQDGRERSKQVPGHDARPQYGREEAASPRHLRRPWAGAPDFLGPECIGSARGDGLGSREVCWDGVAVKQSLAMWGANLWVLNIDMQRRQSSFCSRKVLLDEGAGLISRQGAYVGIDNHLQP